MKYFKRSIFSAALASAVLVSANLVHAEDSGFYVGAGVARDRATLTQDYGPDLSFERNQTVGRILFGYSYNSFLSTELDYADHGQHRFGINTNPDLGSNEGRFKAASVVLAAVGTVPLGYGFSALAKVGLSHNRSKVGFSGFSGVPDSQFSNRVVNNRAMAGVGLKYDINREFAVRGGYDYFGKTGDRNNSLESCFSQVSVDAIYHF